MTTETSKPVNYGVNLGRLNPARWIDVSVAADELGYESVWIPEHLIFPATMSGSPIAGESHPPIPPETPVYDAFVMLAAIAAKTQHLRLGTNVYNIGLRHPFVTARAIATLDIISGGRVEFGVGASWLAEEWDAVGLDFSSRGRRVDEAIDICRRLWTQPVIEHRGAAFDFGPVVFEPKPSQAAIPIHIGGDTRLALRRVAARGDGWIGMVHEPDSFARSVAELETLCRDQGRDVQSVQRTAMANDPTTAEVATWVDAGATRLVVAPWGRSSEATAGLARFSAEHGLADR